MLKIFRHGALVLAATGTAAGSFAAISHAQSAKPFVYDMKTFVDVQSSSTWQDVEWRQQPSIADVAKVLPADLQKSAYANIDCAALRSGRPERCHLIKSAPNDPRVEQAAMFVVSHLRAPYPLGTGKIGALHISLHFRDPHNPGADRYCLAPMCQEGSVPPAPKPPPAPASH